MTFANNLTSADHVSSWSLANGVRVIVAEMRRVPRVEVRLRWQWPHAELDADDPQLSATVGPLIARMIMARIFNSTLAGPAAAAVTASADLDRIAIGGGALVEDFDLLLAGLARALASVQQLLPDNEFGRCVEEVSTNLSFASSRPRTLAMAALTGALFRGHPYAQQLGSEKILRRVTQSSLSAIQQSLVAAAPLVIVVAGDVSRQQVSEVVDGHFGWLPSRSASRKDARLPEPIRPERIHVELPFLSQATLALGRLAPSREATNYPPVLAAQLLLGGYAGSHLVRTLREEHSLVYQPSCNFEHGHMGSALSIVMETRNTNVNKVRELLEIELNRYERDEPSIEDCREVVATFSTTLGLSISSQAGMASTLAELECASLQFGWMADLPSRLRQVTPAEVGDAWRSHLADLGQWIEVDLLPSAGE